MRRNAFPLVVKGRLTKSLCSVCCQTGRRILVCRKLSKVKITGSILQIRCHSSRNTL